MTIVQINAVYERGSTGRIVMELDRAIRAAGDASYVFCTNRSDEENGIFCMGTAFSRKLHGLLSRLTGLQGYYSFFATRKMLKKLDAIEPDIVHLHNLHGNFIHVNMLLDYLVEHQIPTVITLHDCWFFTGHCCHYLEDNCNRWQRGCGRCPARHKWNRSWFFDRSAKVWRDRKERFCRLNSLTVVGVSDWVTNECRKSFMKENARFQRIYNWIDLDVFKPAEGRIPNRPPLLLSVAQGWTKNKGLYDILKIAEHRPDWRFVLVGETPEVKAPKNVELVGPCNTPDELAAWYRQADVFLHLSYQETFGKVIAEALACGAPAVVYDATAMPELIGPNCGAAVPPGDWKAAEDAIAELLTMPKSTDSIWSFAEENFDLKKLTADWLILYRSITECVI